MTALRARLGLKEEGLDMVATTTYLVLAKTIDLSANFVVERYTLWKIAGIVSMKTLPLMISM
jgi:hypothetical protein